MIRRLTASAEPGPDGTAVIDLGGPSSPCRWDLRSLVVLGQPAPLTDERQALAQGLVAYWLSPDAENTLTDVIGGWDAAPVGTVGNLSRVPGLVAGWPEALEFVAGGVYLRSPALPALPAWTWRIVYRGPAFTSGWAGLVGWFNNPYLALSVGTPYVLGAGTFVWSGGSISDGAPHVIHVTWDGSQLRGFVDGVNRMTNTPTSALGSGALVLGAGANGNFPLGANNPGAVLQLPAVWGRPLTAAEVADDAANVYLPPPAPSSLPAPVIHDAPDAGAVSDLTAVWQGRGGRSSYRWREQIEITDDLVVVVPGTSAAVQANALVHEEPNQ